MTDPMPDAPTLTSSNVNNTLILANTGVAAAGGAFKFVLVTRAGYNQGFALAHTPVRGSGSAGPAIKPGWSAPRQVRAGEAIEP